MRSFDGESRVLGVVDVMMWVLVGGREVWGSGAPSGPRQWRLSDSRRGMTAAEFLGRQTHAFPRATPSLPHQNPYISSKTLGARRQRSPLLSAAVPIPSSGLCAAYATHLTIPLNAAPPLNQALTSAAIPPRPLLRYPDHGCERCGGPAGLCACPCSSGHDAIYRRPLAQDPGS